MVLAITLCANRYVVNIFQQTPKVMDASLCESMEMIMHIFVILAHNMLNLMCFNTWDNGAEKPQILTWHDTCS